MDQVAGTSLHWGDIVVIVGYFLGVLLVGIISSIKAKRDSIKGYFLASKSMHWVPVGASLFASNIGSGHFVGLAGSGASTGIGIAGFEMNAMFVLLILGWVFVPVYTAAGVYTMPEYLRKRFGGQRIRIYLSVLALLLYVFTKISADLFAGAIFIKVSLGWNLYLAVVVLLIVAAVFTIGGGLTAVMWTDFVQTILMVCGALALTIISLVKVGGYEKLLHDFYYKQPHPNATGYNQKGESCSAVPDNYNHILRSASDPDLPWTGMIFGLTVSAVWYWCSDQVIVQRALSARNLSHAKAGCIVAAYLKLTPLFLLVLPGMAARVLYTDKIGCSDPDYCEKMCGSRTGCTNDAYPTMVVDLMPAGARGMMLSVMLAALMSSLTSIFNSASTLFTIDIWTRLRRNANEMELLIVGKVFVLALVGVSIAWIPIIENTQSGQLFHYIQSVTSYLSPPVCAVYVLAILWDRINEKGAFWGLMSGLVVGLIRFALEFAWTAPPCASNEPDNRLSIVTSVHYLHFGILLFFLTAIITTVISLLTEPIDPKYLARLTFWTRFSKDVRYDLRKKGHVPTARDAGFTKTAPQINGSDNPGFQEDGVDSKNGYEMKQRTKQMEVQRPNAEPLEELSRPKKFLYFLCGISDELRSSALEDEADKGPPKSLEQEAEEAVESLHENPFWKKVVNGNAIALLVVTGFVWGYYA